MEPSQPQEQSMNRFVSLKSLAAAALLLSTLAATTTAHAQSDVQFSITLGSPGVYVQPAPAYAYPRPVYVQPTPVYAYPRPVYVQPAPVYAYPRPVYVQPAPMYAYPQPVYEQSAPMYGWGHQRHYYHDRHENAQGAWGDYDRDGTPNRYDRFPGNPNRR
jgi:hypothetical protein